MTTIDARLREHRFMAGLSGPQLAVLSALTREVSFDENELILLAGQQSRHFYLLPSGSVCVEVRARAYTVCVQALAAVPPGSRR